MREIKFRVWHEAQMHYLTPGENKKLTFFSEGIPWGLYETSTYCRLVTGDPNAIIHTPGDLLQFTGLKDFNNQDVYDADLIQFNLEDGSVEIGIVRFSKKGFWTSQNDDTHEELLSDELNCKSFKATVIGNIFQNPELIQP